MKYSHNVAILEAGLVWSCPAWSSRVLIRLRGALLDQLTQRACAPPILLFYIITARLGDCVILKAIDPCVGAQRSMPAVRGAVSHRLRGFNVDISEMKRNEIGKRRRRDAEERLEAGGRASMRNEGNGRKKSEDERPEFVRAFAPKPPPAHRNTTRI